MPGHHPAQLGTAPWQCQALLWGTSAALGLLGSYRVTFQAPGVLHVPLLDF